MELIDAQNELALRLYDWSRHDFARELDEGCPLMCSVGLHARYVAAFVSWARKIPDSERKLLVQTLPRRTHELASRLRGEELSRDKQKQFNDKFFRDISLEESALPPLVDLNVKEAARIPVNPRHCLDLMLRLIPSALGKPIRRKKGVHAIRILGDWNLVTMFEFRVPENLLYYEYDFFRIDGEPSPAGYRTFFPRNLFMLYGVTSATVFIPYENHCEPMTKAIIRIAEHFISQAEPIFRGLDRDD